MSRSSIRPVFSACNGYYQWLEDAGVVDRSPMRGITRERVDEAHPRAVDEQDLRRLLDVTKERKSWAIISIIAFSSLTSGELMGCDVSSLEVGEGDTLLHFEPRARRARLPYTVLVSEVAEATVAQLNGRRHGPLFVDTLGKRMTRHSVQGLLETASRRAGLDYVVSAQMLTYALPTAALRHGYSLTGVMKATGGIPRRHIDRWQAVASGGPSEQNATVRFARMILDPPDSVANWLLHAEALFAESDLPEAFVVMGVGAILENHLRGLCLDAGMDDFGQTKNRSSIDKYADYLLRTGVLSVSEKSFVAYLGGLRNDAAHGWFERVEPGSGVKALRGVRDIVTRHALGAS